MTQLNLYTGDKLSSTIFCCLSVFEWGIGNTPPNLHFFQYIQAYKPFADPVPPITITIHHLVRHSSANWIISLFTSHLMSHAQYTWSSFLEVCPIFATHIIQKYLRSGIFKGHSILLNLTTLSPFVPYHWHFTSPKYFHPFFPLSWTKYIPHLLFFFPVSHSILPFLANNT